MSTNLLTDSRHQQRLQNAVEMPACDCKVKWIYLCFDPIGEGESEESRAKSVQWVRCLVPCKHVKALWKPTSHKPCNHSLSLDEWARWLLLTSPGAYRSRPLPAHSARSKNREARIRLMFERRKHGEELFHPLDQNEFPRLGLLEMQAGDDVVVLDQEGGRPCKRKR